MPRIAIPLSAAKVRTALPGRYHDGDALILLVRSPERAFWLFRDRVNSRTQEAGLGRARGTTRSLWLKRVSVHGLETNCARGRILWRNTRPSKPKQKPMQRKPRPLR
jgi:hypothetical protein